MKIFREDDDENENSEQIIDFQQQRSERRKLSLRDPNFSLWNYFHLFTSRDARVVVEQIDFKTTHNSTTLTCDNPK